ncbi:MAG: hypothetical protein H7841_12790 [Magnetospirillum sp. WYHS-4]
MQKFWVLTERAFCGVIWVTLLFVLVFPDVAWRGISGLFSPVNNPVGFSRDFIARLAHFTLFLAVVFDAFYEEVIRRILGAWRKWGRSSHAEQEGDQSDFGRRQAAGITVAVIYVFLVGWMMETIKNGWDATAEASAPRFVFTAFVLVWLMRSIMVGCGNGACGRHGAPRRIQDHQNANRQAAGRAA